MIIENAKYGQGNMTVQAVIDGTFSVIPVDPANRHYAEIMRLVDAGELVIAEPD
jgi:hypothetical protein